MRTRARKYTRSIWASWAVAMGTLPAAHVAYAQTDGGLEEIVVTARKQKESLQDSPVSITAFTNDMLDRMHVDQLDGISKATPNMMFDTGTSFSGGTSAAAIYIRGIGQIDFTLNSEPAIGIYLDGVYIGTSIGSVLDLTEIEQVEVLRGPQGPVRAQHHRWRDQHHQQYAGSGTVHGFEGHRLVGRPVGLSAAR